MQSNVEQYERRKKADPSARLALYQKAFEERMAKKEKKPANVSDGGRK